MPGEGPLGHRTPAAARHSQPCWLAAVAVNPLACRRAGAGSNRDALRKGAGRGSLACQDQGIKFQWLSSVKKKVIYFHGVRSRELGCGVLQMVNLCRWNQWDLKCDRTGCEPRYAFTWEGSTVPGTNRISSEYMAKLELGMWLHCTSYLFLTIKKKRFLKLQSYAYLPRGKRHWKQWDLLLSKPA